MQGIWVQSLVQEDSTCCGAANLAGPRGTAEAHVPGTCALQERNHHSEVRFEVHHRCNKEEPLYAAARESPHRDEDPVLPKVNTLFKEKKGMSKAEHIMRNARLDEAQAGIKIAGRNINNLRYADDTTLMAESGEEPKSL